MASAYFSFTRREIEPLLPKAVATVVDVGCGTGETSAWLKTLFPRAKTVGLEGNPALREELESKVDEVHIVDLNSSTIPSVGPADLVLYLDVLEHLNAPEKLLREMLRDMPSTVQVIVSLPNIAHYSVALPLFLFGRFQYRDAGILDRTHVRFYVRDTAIRMLNDAGLCVTKGLQSGFGGTKSRLFDQLTLGIFRSRLARQYILLAARMPVGGTQTPIRWSPAY